MRTQEKLIYTNERGESIEFSPASSYHVNFKDVTGLSDVRNAILDRKRRGDPQGAPQEQKQYEAEVEEISRPSRGGTDRRKDR